MFFTGLNYAIQHSFSFITGQMFTILFRKKWMAHLCMVFDLFIFHAYRPGTGNKGLRDRG
jgi:hypothetical protein